MSEVAAASLPISETEAATFSSVITLKSGKEILLDLSLEEADTLRDDLFRDGMK